MAGFFDSIFSNPSDQALWALGSGLLGVRRGNEGRAAMGAMEAYNQAQQEQRRNKLTDAQLQFQAMQMQKMQQQLAEQDKADAYYANPSNFMRENPPMLGAPGEQETPTPGSMTPLSPQEIAMKMAMGPSADIRKAGIGALIKPSTENVPANIQEWQHFEKMTPEQKAQYLEMKRQQWSMGNIAGVPTLVPRNPSIPPVPLSTPGAEASGKRVQGAATAEGTASGEQAVKDKTVLSDIVSYRPILGQRVNELLSHPGLVWSTGVLGATDLTVPGSIQKDFVARHKEILGQVFLTARERLRGGGQITDYEGQKAEGAMARMDRAQSAEAYKSAIKDFMEAYDAGIAKLEKRLKEYKGSMPSGYMNPNDQARGVRDLGITERVDRVPGADPLGIR